MPAMVLADGAEAPRSRPKPTSEETKRAQALAERSLLNLRACWTPHLKERLEDLLSKSMVYLGQQAGQSADLLVNAYQDGQGGEEKTMRCFIADYRLKLADMLAEEGAADGAAAILRSDDLKTEQAIAKLEELKLSAADSEASSRYRHSLVTLLYNDNRPQEARQQLQEDIADNAVHPKRHLMSQVKLDALAGIEPESDWRWIMVPAAVRDTVQIMCRSVTSTE